MSAPHDAVGGWERLDAAPYAGRVSFPDLDTLRGLPAAQQPQWPDRAVLDDPPLRVDRHHRATAQQQVDLVRFHHDASRIAGERTERLSRRACQRHAPTMCEPASSSS